MVRKYKNNQLYLKNLSIFQFKNHTNSLFNFNNSVNCFVGKNGAGKTNILDAIHYLGSTKSYFNRVDSQNIQFNQKLFIIKGVYDKNNDNDEVHCSFTENDGKTIKVNNKKYKKFSNHIGKYPTIIISPTDTNLITEGSDVRRKYIDSTISQFKAGYLNTLIQYNKALKQRNSLLKYFTEKNIFDENTLSIYDHQLINLGNSIYAERKDILKRIIPVFKNYYKEISSSNESVDLIYKSDLSEENYSDLLKKSIIKDRYSQYTSTGIHKDDIIFKMNDYSIKKTGSQGQQKSFLIALKLAQFDFTSSQLGFKPILLLDDIFDKLDDERIERIISYVRKNVFNQVFITDTHKQRSKEILTKSGVDFKIHEINQNIYSSNHEI